MKVIVIGGGPAGMMCAGVVGENNNKVILLDKNDKLGKKLYITGKVEQMSLIFVIKSSLSLM